MKKHFTVSIREDLTHPIRPGMHVVNGQTFAFTFGWKLEPDHARYPNEDVWIPTDPSYPVEAPGWIAVGDLKEVTENS